MERSEPDHKVTLPGKGPARKRGLAVLEQRARSHASASTSAEKVHSEKRSEDRKLDRSGQARSNASKQRRVDIDEEPLQKREYSRLDPSKLSRVLCKDLMLEQPLDAMPRVPGSTHKADHASASGHAPNAAALEALIVRLFETSLRSFSHSAALASKLHDRVLLLHKQQKGRSISAAVAMREAASRQRKFSGSLASETRLRGTRGGRSVAGALRAETALGLLTYEDTRSQLAAANEAYLSHIFRQASSAAERESALCDAVLIGADVAVVASRAVWAIGTSGLVVWESAQCVHLLCQCNAEGVAELRQGKERRKWLADSKVVSVSKPDSVLHVLLPAAVARLAGVPVIRLAGSSFQ